MVNLFNHNRGSLAFLTKFQVSITNSSRSVPLSIPQQLRRIGGGVEGAECSKSKDQHMIIYWYLNQRCALKNDETWSNDQLIQVIRVCFTNQYVLFDKVFRVNFNVFMHISTLQKVFTKFRKPFWTLLNSDVPLVKFSLAGKNSNKESCNHRNNIMKKCKILV